MATRHEVFKRIRKLATEMFPDVTPERAVAQYVHVEPQWRDVYGAADPDPVPVAKAAASTPGLARLRELVSRIRMAHPHMTALQAEKFARTLPEGQEAVQVYKRAMGWAR